MVGQLLKRNCAEAYEILKLPPSLLDNSILAAQHNTHATEIPDFCATNNERINVETSACEDARDTREHTRLILNKTVENMSDSEDEVNREDRNTVHTF